MKVDPYLIDTLMRDLVPTAAPPRRFLCTTAYAPKPTGPAGSRLAISHTVLAGLIGISKRSVQIAVAHLAGRRLIRQRKGRPTQFPSTQS